MRWRGKIKFSFLQGQAGISLLETLAAVAILAFIGTTVVRALDTNYRANRTLDEQVKAVNLATGYIDAIKQSSYADNYTSATANITVPYQYTVVIDTYGTNNYTGDNTTWVGPPSSGQTFQKITIAISREGRPVFSMCSFRTKR